MWRVIAPPDNWRGAFEIADEQFPWYEKLARDLSLAFTVEKENRKIYVGFPDIDDWREIAVEAQNKQGKKEGVVYPSGEALPIILWQSMGQKYAPAHEDMAAPLVAWKDENPLLSEHFRLWEFRCHKTVDYGYLRIAPDLILLLEKIREAAGDKPLGVTSGYRPPAYNTAVGGASQSYHVDGLAVDITRPGLVYREFYDICIDLNPNGGVGKYSRYGFCHLDVRGYRARWGS